MSIFCNVKLTKLWRENVTNPFLIFIHYRYLLNIYNVMGWLGGLQKCIRHRGLKFTKGNKIHKEQLNDNRR